MTKMNTGSSAPYRDRDTVTVAEAADYLGIGLMEAYEGCRRGILPAVRIGGGWIIVMGALRRMVEDSAQDINDDLAADRRKHPYR